MKAQRSLKLIANFEHGFARGWAFAVGDFFRDQLDIKLTERKKGGISEFIYTQGPYYCFSEGHIIYDTPLAYQKWDEALKYIDKYCKVLRGVPNKIDENKKFINGQVHFQLLRVDKKTQKSEIIDSYHVTQNVFVEFLKNGHHPQIDMKLHQ
ncbi:MAG: hypothetical protein SWH61_03430 [Thermodesulfobacteriota bacterium]|nr:hypothetical protein [Thermodesulfobacteriota bacterium]